MARVAVAGGTGHIGRQVVEALRRGSHEAVVLSRAAGVDLVAGEGLAGTLAGAQAVVDVTNTGAVDAGEVRSFFGAVTGNLLAAEREAGVRHHVLLSILGVDRVRGSAHYEGKRLQEELVRQGNVPATIVRSAQFHDFAAMVVNWARHGDRATVAPLLIQPIAPADVAGALAEIAVNEPQGLMELAGPEPQDLVDMARRTVQAEGVALRLVPSWDGMFAVDMAGKVMLPGPDVRLAATTFDAWLQAHAGSPSDWKVATADA
jgi:uncharacterized protein YbjT (DUF2867 family)